MVIFRKFRASMRILFSVEKVIDYHEHSKTLLRTLRGGPWCPCHLGPLQIIISSKQLFTRVVGTSDQSLGIFTSLSNFNNFLKLGITNLSRRKYKLSSTAN